MGLTVSKATKTLSTKLHSIVIFYDVHTCRSEKHNLCSVGTLLSSGKAGKIKIRLN